MEPEKLKYNNQDDLFGKRVRAEVNNYFSSNNIKKTGDIRLHLKTIIFMSAEILLYVKLLFFRPESTLLSLFLCGVFGLVLAGIGFNIMHDASHGSYSKKAWVNKVVARVLDQMGASSILWLIKHVTIHHSLTNTVEDDDIDIYPIIRIHLKDKPLPLHRFQAVYAVIFYAILYVVWVFFFDFKKYFAKRIGTHTVKIVPIEHFIFWIGKSVYVFLFVALPWIMFGFGPMLIGFLTMAFVCGLTISIVFQLAHVVETSAFPVADKTTEKLEVPWAQSQVETTSDFAVKSKLAFWLLGGLNFQIEHHLFPKVSHVHYPEIMRIVKRVCNEFNIRHNTPTFWNAIKSHFRTLHRLGTMPQVT
jgi:linoleoyl-CoA desaturase